MTDALFDMFAFVDESLSDRMLSVGYTPDPVLHKFVGITIADILDLRHLSCTVRRPAGNNTLRRWAEVFSSPRIRRQAEVHFQRFRTGNRPHLPRCRLYLGWI